MKVLTVCSTQEQLEEEGIEEDEEISLYGLRSLMTLSESDVLVTAD